MNSRQKGKRGELEFTRILREYGYDARRGQQYNGADGSADVVGIDGLHFEVKRVEKLNLQDACDQARHDARADEIPVVVHRKNNCPWYATLPLDAFLEIISEWVNRNG